MDKNSKLIRKNTNAIRRCNKESLAKFGTTILFYYSHGSENELCCTDGTDERLARGININNDGDDDYAVRNAATD